MMKTAVKRVPRRLLALLLCAVMLLPLLANVIPTVRAAGGEADWDRAMHFIVRHWHVVDIYGNKIYDSDGKDSYEFQIEEGYIVPLVGGGYILAPEPGGSGKPLSDGVVTVPVAAHAPYESFSGFSVSAGHNAVDSSSDAALTIRYDPAIHLAKAHVFYKRDSDTVLGSDDQSLYHGSKDVGGGDLEHDTARIYVDDNGEPYRTEKGKFILVGTTKDDLEEEGDDFPPGFDIKTSATAKIYNTAQGLHTDKTASLTKRTDLPYEDDRTFGIDLEAWLNSGDPVSVGLVLDASGSMGFTSDALKPINVNNDHGAAEALADKIGMVEENGFEGISVSAFPQKENLIGFYPFTKGDYPSTNTVNRDWLVNSADSSTNAVLVEPSYLDAPIDFNRVYEVKNWSSEGRVRMMAGSVPNSGFVLRQLKDSLDSNTELALKLGVVPASNEFAVSFSLNTYVDEKYEKEDPLNAPEHMAEILYIGADSGEGSYLRAVRGAVGAAASQLILMQGDDVIAAIDGVFSVDEMAPGETGEKKYITLVFTMDNDGGTTLSVYVNGSPAVNDIAVALDGHTIVFNPFVDEYDGYPIVVDNAYVYNSALAPLEVAELVKLVKEADNKSTSNSANDVADINATKTIDAFLTPAELALILNPNNTENSPLGTSGYSYFVFNPRSTVMEYAPLGYWDGTKSAIAAKKGNTVIGQLGDGNFSTAGWYYVNPTGNWDANYVRDGLESGKTLWGIAAGQTFTDAIPGGSPDQGKSKDSGSEYTVPDGTYYPTRFYIDGEGYLRCFFSTSRNTSPNNDGEYPFNTSYVYLLDDKDYVKVETLQRALGAFVTKLGEESPDSLVSAVRFSTENTPSNALDKLVLLDWTNDPKESAGILSLNRGEGGTVRGTPSSYLPSLGIAGLAPIQQYNYGLTGGTATRLGLQAFQSILDSRLDKANIAGEKYLIIFTDGKDSERGNDTNKGTAAKIAEELRDDGYTIITVMLAGGPCVPGTDEYKEAEEFLRSLASYREDGETQYFYSTQEGDVAGDPDALIKIFKDEIIGEMFTSVDQYNIQDTIDPRFDLVDAEGYVWHLNAGGQVERIKVTYGPDKDKNGELVKHVDTKPTLTLTDKISEEISFFNDYKTDIALDPAAAKADLYYDSEKDMYYLLWTDQVFPGASNGANKLNVWHTRITLRAKDDFIGGNAVLTNGNEAMQNYVFRSGDESPSSGTGKSTGSWDDVDKIMASKGFPRTVVNVGPPTEKSKDSNEIYMGQGLSETDVINLLIRDAVGAEYLYWEYLYRYAAYYGTEATRYKLTPPEIVVTVGNETYTGTIKGNQVDFDTLLRVAMGKLLNEGGTALDSLFDFGNNNAAVVEAINGGAQVQLQLPYAYLPDVVKEIDENGKMQPNDDPENSTGGKEHRADILGYLTYSVKSLAGESVEGGADDEVYGSYDDDTVTKDKTPRGSQLHSAYSPLPVSSDDDSDDRETANSKLVTEKNGSSPVYGWDKDSKYTKEMKDLELNNENGDLAFEGTRTTSIVSGEIIMQLHIPADVVGKMNSTTPITYEATLNRRYDGKTDEIGKFTLSYTKGETTLDDGSVTVTGYLTVTNDDYDYVNTDYLPIGDYTLTDGRLTSTGGITNLSAGAIEIFPEADVAKGTYDNLFLSNGALTPSDYAAIVDGHTIKLGYKTAGAQTPAADGIALLAAAAGAEGASAPSGRYGGAGVGVSAGETPPGDPPGGNTPVYGNLLVEKTVSAYDGSGNARDLTEEELAQAFRFTIELSRQLSGIYGDVEFVDGVATVTLRHGENVKVTGLPAGISYTVTEAEAEGYTTSAAGASGTIFAYQTARASFTNTKRDVPEVVPTPTPEPTPEPTPPLDDVPKTGDESHTTFWLVLLSLSIMGGCTVALLGGRYQLVSYRGKHVK